MENYKLESRAKDSIDDLVYEIERLEQKVEELERDIDIKDAYIEELKYELKDIKED